MHICACRCQGVYGEVGEQLTEAVFTLSLYSFQGVNLGHQAWPKANLCHDLFKKPQILPKGSDILAKM